MKKLLLLLALLADVALCNAQKMIDYSAGIGSRDPADANVWVLYRGVTARHEGMTLRSDSAHFNTVENSFTAFGRIVITLTDTTFIYGDRLFYDGNTRVVDIWDDTVVLVDGATQLLANHLTYDRNTSTAFYTRWGHAVSGARTLYSRQGQYNSEFKEFYIYGDVHLTDTSMVLFTDTLVYNTATEMAHFESPTTIYSDSSVIRSHLGDYNTATRYAVSYRASRVDGQGYMLSSDTLFYDDLRQYGKARGNVRIVDSANNLTCTGRYGETNQLHGLSFVTDSALVVLVDNGDSLFMHADTVHVANAPDNSLQSVRANYHVKTFRRDAQAMCDSAFYNAADSTLMLYHNPVLWYEHYQCTADTIEVLHGPSGVSHAWFRSNSFSIQQVDLNKFNQLKGRQGEAWFDKGEPLYADVVGNAQMVYYITETKAKGHTSLMGVNAGLGTRIRIYFDSTRAPSRVVTYDKPDMQTYPVQQLPDEWRRLDGFQWMPECRPRKPEEVFVW